MLLIKNGMILPMDGPAIAGGSVLVDDGKIQAVGVDIQPPEGCEIVDVAGAYVTPGLIDGHCHIGLIEEGAPAGDADCNEITDPVTPQMRAVDGINPADAGFRRAYEAGVTTVATGPGSANVVGGQFIAVNTYGATVEDMTVKNPIGMKCAFGENPKRCYGGQKKAPMTRMATAAMLRDTLQRATEYAKEKNVAEGEGRTMKQDTKMEAMMPVIRGELPLKAHAHRTDDMMTALRIAKEFNVRITLDHCTEAHLILPQLKEENWEGLFVGPSFGVPGKREIMEKGFETAGLMHQAGLPFAIITDAPVIPIERLALCAGLCVAEGLPEEQAWKAITIIPAQILGIDQQVGSLTVGKRADIAIFRGNPLKEIGAKNVMTLIGGAVVYDGR